MIQHLTKPAVFCPIPQCKGLDLPACPHLGEPDHCRIVEPTDPSTPILEAVEPIIEAPRKRGLFGKRK